MTPTLFWFSQFVLAASIWDARIWYAIPLVVVVSLVYGATRHERIKDIFEHAFRSVIWLTGFMGAILAIIWVMGYWN